MIGKVINVFIPDDNMNMIGFKVQLEDEVLEVVQEQNKDNCNIYREDLVSLFYIDENLGIKKIVNE